MRILQADPGSLLALTPGMVKDPGPMADSDPAPLPRPRRLGYTQTAEPTATLSMLF
jgi:hypothetical protein